MTPEIYGITIDIAGKRYLFILIKLGIMLFTLSMIFLNEVMVFVTIQVV